MQTSAMSLFNQRVIEKLHADGLTIKDLADKIGMHRQALSKILNGHVDTTMGNANESRRALR
jgi:transcriptional regulator with XRE-family HTH domain